MTNKQARGPLLIVGGAEDKLGECSILRTFVQLAGGSKAKIAVLPMASNHPLETGERYTGLFHSLGAAEVRVLHLDDRDAADEPEAVTAIEQVGGIFFTGGTQRRIVERIAGSALETALHRRHAEGLVVAGTSAGAAVMSSLMIVEGKSFGAPRLGSPLSGPGLGLLKGAIVDQHFSQRNRLGRLLALLAQHPNSLGIGIDEDTALVVRGDALEVIGRGSVTIVDASAMSYTNVGLLSALSSPISLCDVRLHVLSAGLGFNLKERQPIAPGTDFELALGLSA
jgi:cyanophycinase